MNTPPPGSSTLGWRSEEDYYLSRLAIRLGFMTEEEVPQALLLQSQMLTAGQPLGLGQILLREGRLNPASAIELQHELARCFHLCATCEAGNWHAPGPEPRREACRGCGAALNISAAGTSLSQTFMDRRLSAVDNATARFRGGQPVLASSGQGPRLFAHYIIELELARGGMGAVYRVRHAETGEFYALKVLLAAEKATEKQIHRFKREARAQIELGDHPNIVKIHEAGEWEGIMYAVMDLVDGSDLGTAKAGMSRNERVACIAKVARAMDHAHKAGYIHRDLKPDNILLTKDHQPLVTDFGLAKHMEGTTQLTQDGAAMGTPFYMAPEQAVGDVSKMGRPSDVYSLGVILYELLCGDVPFRADSTLELYRKILELTPAPFAEHGVPEPQLEQICFKAMQKDVALRYQSAGAFAQDVERVLAGEKPLASQITSAEKMARSVETHKHSIAMLLVGVVASLVVVVVVALGLRVAMNHHREQQAKVQREQDSVAAVAALDKAINELETLPAREALRGLDEALALVPELYEGEDFPGRASLATAWAEALAARTEAGLRWGAGREALAGLERLKLAGELDLDAEAAEQLLLLRVRCLWRVGRFDEGREAIASTPGPAAALIRAEDEGLRRGQPEAALKRLTACKDSPARRFLEARLLLALGRDAEANRALQAAIEKQPAYRTRWLHALAAADRLADALDLGLEILRIEPTRIDLAPHVATLAQALGRDHEALHIVRRMRKRQADEPTLMALHLRLRARLGEDVGPALSKAPPHPELAILRAEVAFAGGKTPPSSDDPHVQATVAALTSASIPDSARALLGEIPHDTAPDPTLARGLRGLARALHARGEAEPARRAAEASWRGLHDSDSALLLSALADEAHKAAARARASAALRRELNGLQGPLGRGFLLARWSWAFATGRQAEAAKAKALHLLRARKLGGHKLAGVIDREIARLSGAPLPTLEPLADWDELLPPIALPRRADIPPETLAASRKAALEASNLPRRQNDEAIAATQAVLAANPYEPMATWELSTRHGRARGPLAAAARLSQMRVQPHMALNVVLDIRMTWIRGFLGVATDPAGNLVQNTTKRPKWLSPSDLRASRVLCGYLGDLYEEDKKPSWPAAASRAALRESMGDLVRHDPLYIGFLYLHAHLAALDGLDDMAHRDLELLRVINDPEFMGRGRIPVGYFDRIYRAWILSSIDQTKAGDCLKDLSGLATIGKDATIFFGDWIRKGPALDGLRRHPNWKAFVRVVGKKK